MITLTRTESSDQGTFGILKVGSTKFLTGELPWRDNTSGISCLPPGQYKCVWSHSARLKRFCYEVLEDFAHRDGIRIHSANLFGDRARGYRSEISGCIALGFKLGFIDGQRALVESRLAVKTFEQTLKAEAFLLEIKNADTLLPTNGGTHGSSNKVG